MTSEKCQCCNTGIDPEEIYTDFFYCGVCHNNFPYQPERLSEKTYYRNEDGTYPHLEPVIGCDSLTSMET